MRKTTIKRNIMAAMAGAMTISTLLTGCVNDKKAEQKPEFAAASVVGGNTTTKYEAQGELDDTLGKGVNHLAFGLASTLNVGDDNYFFSPYSISSALTILDNAACGTTKAQMESVLGIENLDAWNNQLALFRHRDTGKRAYVTTADSLWIEQSYVLKQSADDVFFPVVRDGLGAEVFAADFVNHADQMSEEIMKWVSDKTNGMIPDYHSISSEDTKMDILDAVYFYGEWTYPFEAYDTYDATFHGTLGDSEVKFMKKYDTRMQYYNDGMLQGVCLPYANGTYVMNLVIPVDKENCNAMELFESLSEEEKNRLLTDVMTSERVMVDSFKMPKFSFDSSFEGLLGALKSLGMTEVFGTSADLSILSDTLYASDIAHRARIEVDEEGSRAAAVTEIDMVDGCAMAPEDPIRMIVDCPFLFFIQDTTTGMVVFMGGVSNL